MNEMISIVQAKVEIQKGFRMFKAFEKAEEVISILESAEQLTREMRAAAEAALATKQKWEAEAESAAQRLKKTTAEESRLRKLAESHEQVIKNAENQALEIIANANQEAQTLFDRAAGRISDAEKIRNAAEEYAKARIAKVDAEIAAKNDELTRLDARVREMKETLSKLGVAL